MDENGSTDPTTSAPKPATTQAGDDRVAALAAYLRKNSGSFTDEALADAARDAGYSDAEIAAARTVADPTTDIGPAAPARRVDRGVVAAVAIAYIVVLYLLISAAAAVSSDASGAIGLVGLLGGVIAWALLREERPSLAQGIGCGVVLAIAIPLIVILVILGICLVAGTGQLTG